MEPLKKWVLRPLIVVVLAPIILPCLLIECVVLLGQHVVMPIYYFAKYRNRLMQVLYREEFDEQAIKYQGSLEQMNDMEDERGGIGSPDLHAYNERFEEMQIEKEAKRRLNSAGYLR